MLTRQGNLGTFHTCSSDLVNRTNAYRQERVLESLGFDFLDFIAHEAVSLPFADTSEVSRDSSN